MFQMFRFPQSGASTCCVLSGKYYDKTHIYSQCLQNRSIFKNHSDFSITWPAINKKIGKTRRNLRLNKRIKETEILKITKTETTQTTMKLGKLNASHVAAFVEEPGMILNNVKNVKVIKNNGRNDIFSSGMLKLQEDTFSSISRNEEIIRDFKSPVSNVKNIVKKTDVDSSTSDNVQYSANNGSQKFKQNQQEYVTTKDSSTQTYRKDPFKKNDMDKMNFGVCTEKNYVNSSATGVVEKTKFLKEDLQLESNLECESETSKTSESVTSLDLNYVKLFRDNGDVHPYVDVCVHCNLLDHAFNFLTGRSTKVKNPKIYQTLLHKFAQNGDWFQAQLLIKKMESFGVPYTPQTFALYILSVANGEICDALERTALILEKIQSEGFQIDDLFTKTFLMFEERELVLRQIRKLVPFFDIPPTTVNLNANCPLVENLNKNQEALISPAPFLTKAAISDAVEKQLSLENEQICTVKKIVTNGRYSVKYRKMWAEINELWTENFRKEFDMALKILKINFEEARHKKTLYPYMLTLSGDNFVRLANEEIDKLINLSEGYSESTNLLYTALGHRVYQMYCREKKAMNEEFSKRMKRQIEIYCRWYANPTGPARNARQKWQMLMGDDPDIASAFTHTEIVPWTPNVEFVIGKFLYNIIFKSTIIPKRIMPWKNEEEDIPAFYLLYRQKELRLREEVKLHPFLSTIIKKANFDTMKFPAYLLPMMCPPKPWSCPDNGGYYFLYTGLLRSHTDKINKDFLKSVPNQNLYAVFDALNKLQSVPWTINEEVLDVAIKIFKSGGSEELNIPVKPSDKPLTKIPSGLDYFTKLKMYKERRKLLMKRQNQYGLWCESLYKLSLANHFRKTVFWLPQNLDFRGRVYPVPSHVSHVSADLYRSFLMFANRECLGEKGFDWLKAHVLYVWEIAGAECDSFLLHYTIHTINLTGAHKKKSLQQRLEYANQVLPDILDSAENPLTGKKWWMNSDDPWQTLAACFEIRKAIKSGNPKTFKSGFPVHQDGSCNGLQHYAALGRDKCGAISVNLSPSEFPQDIYSDIAALVEIERAKDEEKGVEIAKLLNGLVNRKVVKRPVMTTVYGVTWFGAKKQIAGVLTEITDLPSNMIMPAASYLTQKIFEILRKLFTSAKEIQDWFNKCTHVIAGHYNQSVSWQNPIGLPTIQPYFSKSKAATSMTPNLMKQKNAFAPNFIHSLDSTHMMLTALNCEPAGITFASVHDCFWTHPSRVDEMNKICRENFVNLHSQKILENLSEYFIKTYASDQDSEIKNIFTDIPKLGDFNLNSVNDSVYFFA